MSLNERESEFLNNVKHDTLKLIIKLEKLEQQIINLNAKYKNQTNEIMLMLEDQKTNNDSLWETLKKVETRMNDKVDEVAVVTKWENDKKKTKNMTSCIGYRGED